MQKKVDSHWRHVAYAVGDWVYIRLRPHRQHCCSKDQSKVVTLQFLSFQIMVRIGDVENKVDYHIVLESSDIPCFSTQACSQR